MRLFPVLAIIVLTGSALALLICAIKNGETFYEHSEDDGESSHYRSRRSPPWNQNLTENGEEETSNSSSDTSSSTSTNPITSILHRIKRSLFFRDRKYFFLFFSHPFLAFFSRRLNKCSERRCSKS